MKYDEVVVFGCSWAYGDELPEETRLQDCFGGLIASYYNAKLVNFGINGGSNLSSQWEFLQWLTTYDPSKKYLVIVALTDSNRTSWYHDEFKNYGHSVTSTDLSDTWYPAAKLHVALSSGKVMRRLTYTQTIELFNGACKERNIDVLQFNIWPYHDVLDHYPDTLFLPRESMMEKLTNPSWLAPNKHPNKDGHIVISSYIIPEINRRYGTK